MSIFRRDTKKAEGWCFEFRLHGHRVKRGGFRTEEEARNAETIARARILDARMQREYGMQAPRGRIPILRSYITETYLPEIKARLSPSSYHAHRRMLNQLVALLGMHRVSDLGQAHLQAYRDQRAKSLSANSLRLEFSRLRQLFRALIEAGYLQANPGSVGLPRETQGPDRILTADEEIRLLAGCWTQRTRDMIEFSLWTGLRPGELVGLRGRMVDLEGSRLILPQPKVERPKVVPLMPEAMAILLRQPPFGPDDPVFRGINSGRAVHELAYRRAFRTAVKRSGIAPMRPTDLRHSFAVRLIRTGADLATVGDLLGHRPPYRTTARYLAHTSEDRKREVLSRLVRHQESHQEVKNDKQAKKPKGPSR